MTSTATDLADADALLTETVMTDAGRQDPYPAYATLRATSPRWRTAAGSIVCTRHGDCMEVLRHPRLGRSEPDMEVPATFGGRTARSRESTSTMLLLNPPDHTRLRGLVSRAFTPRRVDQMRGSFAALLDPLLEHMGDLGTLDVMSELAVPFPVAVISELLGVPREGNEHIRPKVRDLTALIDPASDDAAIAAGEHAAIELAMYFWDLVEHKRRQPDDHLLSALIEVEAEGDRLSPEELIANTILLYAAGFETTSNLIGNGLRLLLAHPDQLERLRQHPELVGAGVLEMLRADSPVQLNMRMALDEVQLFDETHPRGTAFVVLQGSGNHDEAVYERPERFDVGRFSGTDAPQPLSFGWGAHHCLGAHLARAEGELVFTSLLERFAEIELDVDALDRRAPRYRPSFTLRGLESLPVVVRRAG